MRVCCLLIGIAMGFGLPDVCLAGMPSVLQENWQASMKLTELTVQRLQAISFFSVGLLICAIAVQFLWNVVAKESNWLPKLTFGKAFVLILLWGSLFVIVLTMISGARELLTPGAWKQEGMIYKLNTDGVKDEAK